MLEYANTRDLVEEVTKIIAKCAPTRFFHRSGSEYVRWHKTTIACRQQHAGCDSRRRVASLFPEPASARRPGAFHRAARVYYYVTDKDANQWVNIDSWWKKSLTPPCACQASGSHPSINTVPIGTRGSRKDQGRNARSESPRKTGTTWKRFAPPSDSTSSKIVILHSRDRETTLFLSASLLMSVALFGAADSRHPWML